jgi:hypothetical protein
LTSIAAVNELFVCLFVFYFFFSLPFHCSPTCLQENNPLVRRVMQIFDADDSGAVDFKEFIVALSIFANPEHREEKLHCTSHFVCKI